MYQRILQLPKSSFFLLGPRGTGKSTWLKQQFPDAHTINLLDERLFQTYLADAGKFGREMSILPPGTVVVIDEVQRLPQLLNDVHRLIEDKNLRFALSGSSARKLRQAGVNLLAGRAVRREMWPLLPEELHNDFDLTRILQLGSLPIVWASEDPRDTLEAYVTMYLREEIQAEALVRNLSGFARFLPIAALCHGQSLSVSNLSRDAEVARTTVAGYIDILKDTLLAFELEGYEAKLRVKERKHPKFYFIDPGLVRSLKRQVGTLGLEEKGALFEGWLVATMRAYQSYRRSWEHMAFWAPTESSSLEVDLVLIAGDELVAIEIKSASKVKNEFFKGLRAFAEHKKLKRKILVYLGDSRQKTPDGIEILPIKDFLAILAAGHIFTESM